MTTSSTYPNQLDDQVKAWLVLLLFRQRVIPRPSQYSRFHPISILANVLEKLGRAVDNLQDNPWLRDCADDIRRLVVDANPENFQSPLRIKLLTRELAQKHPDLIETAREQIDHLATAYERLTPAGLEQAEIELKQSWSSGIVTVLENAIHDALPRLLPHEKRRHERTAGQ